MLQGPQRGITCFLRDGFLPERWAPRSLVPVGKAGSDWFPSLCTAALPPTRLAVGNVRRLPLCWDVSRSEISRAQWDVQLWLPPPSLQ